jgi:hypothetical protein
MTEEEIMNKMRGSADKFRELCYRHEYVRAINLYHRVHAVALYVELPEDKLTELFGSYEVGEDDEKLTGLFDKQAVLYVAEKAMKQEIEENRRGNPTQIHDFNTYLPRSYFRTK